MAEAKDIFLEALDQPTEEARAKYLDSACAGDAALRARVQDLLRAHDQAGSFLGGAWTGDTEPLAEPLEAVGTFVGAYKLLERLGEGGFGVVYLAEQHQPVRRKVALKVIKPGMDTRDVIARFEVERQALAIMDHPNIARVLDAGATSSGRPFFVMELVRGLPITEYCDLHNLTPRARLELFLDVCHAVQHAHQKGIIHRDIKPTNVLVTSHDGRPVVKVIDFGVAKAISGQLTEHSVYTRFAQMIGTPLYMSPEQAELSGLDIDTRTDIYSLGVLLYELLTGATPFDHTRLQKAGLDEIRRIIREEDPPKPSTRLSDSGDLLPSIAASRQTEPARLTRLMRGDLDWIVMKALEKDRRRRYETANGMARDVQAYLADEPVTAAAPSRRYRIAKFVRRNKYGVVMGTVVILLLTAGLIGTSIGLLGESRERNNAVDAAEQLEAVNAFLIHDLFSGVESHRTSDKAIRDEIVKVMIDPAAAKVAERFRSQPMAEARVRQALALSYESLDRTDLAIPQARKALAIARRIRGPKHADTYTMAGLLGTSLQSTGELDEAEPLLRECLAGRKALWGNAHPATVLAVNNLAALHQARGDFARAEELYREAIENSRLAQEEDEAGAITALNNLGHVLRVQGKFAESLQVLGESLDRSRRVLGENHRSTFQATSNFGAALRGQGKLDEAARIWRDGLERAREVFGPDDSQTLHFVNDYAGLLLEQAKFAEAEPFIRDTLERRRKVLGEDHPDTIVSLINLGTFLERKGDHVAAEPLLREGLQILRRIKGDDHRDTLMTMSVLSKSLLGLDKSEEAERLMRELLERGDRALPDDDPFRAQSRLDLALLLHVQQRLDEAEPLYLAGLEMRRRLSGAEHLDTFRATSSLGGLRVDQGRPEAAEPLLREALAGYVRVFRDPDHPEIGTARTRLGRALTQLSRFAEAEVELVEAERILRTTDQGSSKRVTRCWEALTGLYEAWQRPEEAARWRSLLEAPP